MSTVIPFPGAAIDEASEERGAAIETCMNNIGAIISLLHETVEGERFTHARAYLTEQLDANVGVLGSHLSAMGHC